MGGKKQKNPNTNWSHKNDFQIKEVWNTYHTIAQLIVARLQAFKALDKHGYCPYFKDMREWNCTIQKMIDALTGQRRNIAERQRLHGDARTGYY